MAGIPGNYTLNQLPSTRFNNQSNGFRGGTAFFDDGTRVGDEGVHGWRGIIAVPRGKEHLYDLMPPPGGWTQANPAVVYTEGTARTPGAPVKIFVTKGGKKVIKKLRNPEEKEREISLEEGMEDTNKMFKYLKQYNRRKDNAWNENEKVKYRDL
jgi:hypothetical protein